jgi:hypothetical protein
MVNNSKKRNNHFSSHIIDHEKEHNMPMEIQILAWDMHKHVAGFNMLMEFQPTPS